MLTLTIDAQKKIIGGKYKAIIEKRTHKYSKVQHHNIPNLVERNFNCFNINEKWSIDLSYIFAVNGLKYLCAIKDLYVNQ